MIKIHVPVPHNPGIYKIMFRDEAGKLHAPKHGAKYQARYSVLQGGRTVTKGFACFSLAEAKQVRFLKGPIERKSIPVVEVKSDPADMLFSELLERWRLEYLPHLAKGSQARCLSKVRHFSFFAQKRARDISSSDVLAWLAEMKKPDYLKTQKASRTSYREEWAVLRGVLCYYRDTFKNAYVLPYLSNIGAKLVVRPPEEKREKDLSIEEFQAFASELKKICTGEHEVIYYLALFQYGIYGRIQEAAALHFEDFTNDSVHVRRKVEWTRDRGEPRLVQGSKTGKGKVIPTNAFLRSIFNEWKLKSGRRAGLLLSYKGELLTYRMIQYRYDMALKAAGISHRGTHLIRHASLTEVYHRTKDLKTTASLAGHRSIATTQRYAKARSVETEKAQERMGEELLGVLG